MLKETKAAKQPIVYVDLELSSNGQVKFIIGNSGVSPATNIQFRITDTIPWQEVFSKNTPELSQISPIKNGISYLAPKRVLKYTAGYIPRGSPSIKAFSENSYANIFMEYKTEDHQTFEREFTIHFNQYSHVLSESFSTPELEIAQAIRDAESSRQSDHMSNSLFRGMLGKKYCPICMELIGQSAKKCPQCHEFIADNDPKIDRDDVTGGKDD